MPVPAPNERVPRLMSPTASKADHASARLDAGSLGNAFATGGLLGMVWSPCSEPMLASALTIMATEGGALRGRLVLGVFGLGAATVLVAAANASRAGFGRVRGWVLAHMDRVKRGFGVLVLLLGLVILLGADKARGADAARDAARLNRPDHSLLKAGPRAGRAAAAAGATAAARCRLRRRHRLRRG